jgi:hypothetical protein
MRKFFGERRDHLARRRRGECWPQEGCQRNQGAPPVAIAIVKRSDRWSELSMQPFFDTSRLSANPRYLAVKIGGVRTAASGPPKATAPALVICAKPKGRHEALLG